MNQSNFRRTSALKAPSRETRRFDALARSVGAGASRRSVIGGVLGTLGLGAFLPLSSEAKKHKRKNKKSKKKKLRLNQFECVNQGGACRGNNANCCSGVCDGKKPKKGEVDRSTCVGHNEGGCTAERNACIQTADNNSGNCNAANPQAFCVVTTGNASFCSNFAGSSEQGNCRACRRDTDCTAEGFPSGTACVQVNTTGRCSQICAATGNRVCLPPAA
jgi:hypothetical protein